MLLIEIWRICVKKDFKFFQTILKNDNLLLMECFVQTGVATTVQSMLKGCIQNSTYNKIFPTVVHCYLAASHSYSAEVTSTFLMSSQTTWKLALGLPRNIPKLL